MTGVPYKHVILTRYFVRFDPQAKIDLKPGWFEERYRLFSNYCLPSVVAQTDQNFIWLLYFDTITPPQEVERVRALLAPYPHYKVLIRDQFLGEGIIKDALEEAAGADWLLTTRIDNDDGLRRDFIERLHAATHPGSREFLNFPTGIISYRKRLFLYRHASNAFISLSEPATGATTVWCAPHEELHRFGPIRQIDPFPAFVQVIHGSNKSNKPRGSRVRKILALAGFEAIAPLFAKPLDEGEWPIMAENLTAVMVWRVRDFAIHLVKKVLRGGRGH